MDFHQRLSTEIRPPHEDTGAELPAALGRAHRLAVVLGRLREDGGRIGDEGPRAR
jgi:hypothetical protein